MDADRPIRHMPVRLVGRCSDRIARLARPNLTVTGEVESMAPELAKAHLIAVPIRYGSGMKGKVAEAMQVTRRKVRSLEEKTLKGLKRALLKAGYR